MVSTSSFISIIAALATFAGCASAVPVTGAASSAAASATSASSSSAASSTSSSAASSASSVAASSTWSSAAAASSSAAPAWTVPSGWAVASSSCIAEGSSGRALTWTSTTSSSMTVEKCLAYCDNYNMPLAGLEYSGECYCGNVLGNGASLNTKSNSCYMPCNGDSGRLCGGPGALSLYVSTKSNAASLSSDYTSTTLTLPSGWSTMGCYAEGKTGRALDGYSYSGILNTATCINYCKNKGYSMAGLEYGGECYCDNAFRNGAGASATTCNMPCNGGPGENCGGANVLQVYSNPSLAPTTSTSNGYSKQACIQEVSGRALTGASTSSDTMTVDTCTSFCKSSGFTYAAVEYGKECYCGNSLVNGASLSKYSTQCTMTCAGNKKQNCGGPNALQLYASS